MNITTLKNSIDIIEVASRYVELKKINSNQYQAKENILRAEQTSSLFFYVNTQKAHDFGSGKSYDVFDLVATVENKSLTEVMEMFKNDNVNYSKIEHKTPIKEDVINVSSEQLLKEFDRFERLNINNPSHKDEVMNVIPFWLYETAQKEDLELFLYVARYDSYNKTLVAGWYDNQLTDLKIITYKRRRLNGGKWVNKKDTHPNQTIFHRIYDDTKAVYIVEGARDSLTSILLGLNFIAIPTASFKNVELIKEVVKDKEVIFICEDLTGYKAMKSLSEFIPNSKMVTFVNNKIDKIDLSDFVMGCNSIDEVLNVIK
ncbi:MAG: CHC2 zinc finger domain-containing protein [Arcobacteraceae bacterium]|jgi:DNA primase|nr:CHC2 zinc finger domain-containing protein [Arcobacteraceae bacterium]